MEPIFSKTQKLAEGEKILFQRSDSKLRMIIRLLVTELTNQPVTMKFGSAGEFHMERVIHGERKYSP
jgi:hypothetical protein